MDTRAPFPKSAIGGWLPDFNPQAPNDISNSQPAGLKFLVNHSKQKVLPNSNSQLFRGLFLPFSRSVAAPFRPQNSYVPPLPSYRMECFEDILRESAMNTATTRRVSMPSFPGVDFLDFDSLLSDEEKLARQTARQFVDDQIMPIIEQYNREGRFPVQLVPQMAELGLFGASLKGYGCAGMSNVEYGLVTQELERGDSSLRSFVSVQSALVMYPIYTFGTDEQKNTWLPAMQKGEKLGCFGLTEPDFGSNPGGMRTRAKKVGKEYVLNGEKMWITSGTIADVAVIWAKVGSEDVGTKKGSDEADSIRGFLVETDRSGFKASDIHGKWSLRASVTSGLSLQDVRIP